MKTRKAKGNSKEKGNSDCNFSTPEFSTNKSVETVLTFGNEDTVPRLWECDRNRTCDVPNAQQIS